MEEQSESPKQTFREKSKANESALGGAIVVIIFFVVIGFFIFKAVNHPKAKFEVSEIKTVFIDNQTVSVAFRVQNTGKAAGTPYCQVNAHDPNSDYYGGNSGKLDSQIKAENSLTTAMPVTITKQGAQYVTTADVTCH